MGRAPQGKENEIIRRNIGVPAFYGESPLASRVDETVCDAVLAALVEAHFLVKTNDGTFVRQDGRSN